MDSCHGFYPQFDPKDEYLLKRLGSRDSKFTIGDGSLFSFCDDVIWAHKFKWLPYRYRDGNPKGQIRDLVTEAQPLAIRIIWATRLGHGALAMTEAPHGSNTGYRL